MLAFASSTRWLRPAVIGAGLAFLAALLFARPAAADTPIGGGIGADTVLTPAGNPYVVVNGIRVFGGVTLTLQPGVELRFQSDTDLSIEGTLIAQGSAASPITFTAAITPPSAGAWRQVVFQAGSRGRLSNCLVQYAGQWGYPGIGILSSDVVIGDCRVRDNANDGVAIINQPGLRPTLQNLTITNNSNYAIWQAGDASATYKRLVLSGNGTDAIGTSGNTTVDATWDTSQAGAALRIDTYFRVAYGTVVTLAPGTEVGFDPYGQFEVTGGLIAEGTPGQPITFTSALSVPHAGDWQQIYAWDIARLRLSHCLIAYAGVYNYAAVELRGNDAILRDCRIRDSKQTGLLINGALHPSVEGMTITRSGGYAIWQSPDASALYRRLSLTDNGRNAIGTSGNTNVDATWDTSLAGTALEVEGFARVYGGTTLTLTPGTEVRLAADALFEVTGGLIAEGTAGMPITFTSALTSPSPGAWEQIFAWAGSRLRMSHCLVRYAGVGGVAALELRGSDAVLRDCQIRDSAQTSILVYGAIRPTLERITVTNSGGYAVWQSPQASPIYRRLTLTGNGANAIGTNGNADADATWDLSEANAALQIDSYSGVWAGRTLTIAAGSEIRLVANGQLEARGLLRADGTAARPITFTSALTQPQPGAWQGIEVFPTGRLILTHASIDYAGSPGGRAIGAGTDAQVSIRDSRIRRGGGEAVHASNARVVISGSALYSNTFGVVNDTPELAIDARHNFWGAPTGPHHPTLNPDGQGDGVSDGVLFDPWIEGTPDSMSDLAVVAVSGPASGQPGQTVQITFSVTNNGLPTTAGAWTDSVYLSNDMRYDLADRLIGRVAHAGALASGQSYSASLSAPLPVGATGEAWILVVADSRRAIADCNRGNNVRASDAAVQFSVPELTPGITTTGMLGEGEEWVYRVTAAGGSDLRVTASFAADGQGELYGRFLAVPSPSLYDAVPADLDAQVQAITLQSPPAGAHYVLLRGLEGAGPAQPFALTAQWLGFELRSATPDHGGQNGRATLTLIGAGFSPSATASLKRGAATRGAAETMWRDANTLFATFDLSGLSLGEWDLQVIDGANSAALPNAFTVETIDPGRVEARISSIGAVRPNREIPVTVDYANPGNTDVIAPYMVISAANAILRWADREGYSGDAIQALGINPDGPAGTLPPGASGRLSFVAWPKTTGLGQTSDFELLLVGNPNTPLDWSAAKAALKPPQTDPAGWDVIWARFVAAVTTGGSTIGRYQEALARNATALSQFGEYTADADRLMQFELAKAGNFGAIEERYALGAFGRGWPDLTVIMAVTQTNGSVLIRYGALPRVFERQPDGGYQAATGDLGALSVGSGVFELREGDGTRERFRADGRLDYTEDANGYRITIAYSGTRVSGYTDTRGESAAYAWNAQGRISQMTDSAGRITTFGYDADGDHLVAISSPRGSYAFSYVTGQGAAREHAIASISYPDGLVMRMTYDPDGRLSVEGIAQSPAGAMAEPVTYTWASANELSTLNAAGARSTWTALDHGGLAQVIDPLGIRAQIRYDANGKPIEATGPDNVRTRLAWDGRGNPAGITDPLGRAMGLSVDEAWNELTALRDPRGALTTLEQDSRGNLTAIGRADGARTEFALDARGLVTATTNRRGRTTRYDYDSLGALVRRVSPDGSQVTYAWDAHRNLTQTVQISNTTRLTTTFAYDAADRLTRVTNPNGRYTQYTYDSGGRLTATSDQSGFIVSNLYDAATGRLAAVRQNGTTLVTYTYDAAGRPVREDRANGTVTRYDWDLAGQMLSTTVSAPGGAILARFEYVYDRYGQRAQVTSLEGVTRYGYDAAGQLISATLPSGRALQYAYDASGNRATVTDNGVTAGYTANALNEYTAVDGAPLSWDADGNLLAQGAFTYAWDDDNRLVGMNGPDGAWTFEYDAMGHRVAATRNGQRTEYLIDWAGAGDVVAEYAGDGTLLARYAYGLGLVGRIAGGSVAHYGFDANGNTALLSDPSGAAVNRYTWLPYGEPLTTTAALSNPFGFGGRLGMMALSQNPAGNGWLLARARAYAPGLGRFTSQEPRSYGTFNAYSYADNDPVNFLDPDGFRKTTLTWRDDFFTPGNVRTWINTFVVEPRYDRALQGVYGARANLFVNTPARFRDLQPLRTAINQSQSPLFRAQTIKNWYSTAGKWMNRMSMVSDGLKIYGALRDYRNGTTSGWDATHDVLVSGLKIGMSSLGWVPMSGLLIDAYDLGTQRLFNWLLSPDADALARNLMGPRMLRGGRSSTLQRSSFDPNDVVGPAGYGPLRFVADDQTLLFTIRFENATTATAPAQIVVVTQTLDDDLDWGTFELAEFGFGENRVEVPAGRKSFSAIVDVHDTLTVVARITASLNLSTGVASWRFVSLDPGTGDLPEDPLLGFLPPNAPAPLGEGFVRYRIRAREPVTTGTRVDSWARIFFDENPPIDTPVISHTFDAGAPTSAISALPPTSPQRFMLGWTAADDPGGSGVAGVDIYASVDGGPFGLWQSGMTMTVEYSGSPGEVVAFFSVAQDNVGHTQPMPAGAQASTTLRHMGQAWLPRVLR